MMLLVFMKWNLHCVHVNVFQATHQDSFFECWGISTICNSLPNVIYGDNSIDVNVLCITGPKKYKEAELDSYGLSWNWHQWQHSKSLKLNLKLQKRNFASIPQHWRVISQARENTSWIFVLSYPQSNGDFYLFSKLDNAFMVFHGLT